MDEPEGYSTNSSFCLQLKENLFRSFFATRRHVLKEFGCQASPKGEEKHQKPLTGQSFPEKKTRCWSSRMFVWSQKAGIRLAIGCYGHLLSETVQVLGFDMAKWDQKPEVAKTARFGQCGPMKTQTCFFHFSSLLGPF